MSTVSFVKQPTGSASVRRTESKSLLWMAWGVMLLVSALPDIYFLEFGGGVPSWLKWTKIAFLAALALLSVGWQSIRSLRSYFVLLALIYLAPELLFRLTQLDWWQTQFNYSGATFAVTMLGEQGIRLIVSLVMIASLLLLGFRRADFFLVKGQLDAPAAPEWLFGMKSTEPWSRFGWRVLGGAIVVLGIFLSVAAWSKLDALPLALPILPAVLLMALLNAFNEEMTYRAALLASLHKVIGDRQAVYLAAALFGLGHYNGVPYGVTGVLMATFLGWLLGKAMIETKGFVWAWLIHIVMDVMIFSLMAIGSITAGGG